MAVNEIVRVQVILEGGDESVQSVRLIDEQIRQLVDALGTATEAAEDTGVAIEETFEDLSNRLRTGLTDPMQRAALTIGQVRDAQNDLNRAFATATSNDQRREIAQLRREYDGLEQEIVEASDAQDIFRTQLGGFGAQGSAAAATLIQATRGIEDLRFGLFAAINNIEPVISSFQRLERVQAATAVSIREQLIAALGGPAGLLFLFQSILTVSAILGPALAEIFKDGQEDAEDFQDIIESIAETLLDFEDFDISFKFTADVGDLEANVDAIDREINRIRESIRDGFDVQFGQAAVVDTLADGTTQLNFLTREQLRLQQQIKDFQEEGSIFGEERTERLKEDLTFLEETKQQFEEQLRLLRLLSNQAETLERIDVGDRTDGSDEDLAKEAEREAERLARLRERLNRELAASRSANIENEADQEIAKAEEVFRRRIDLANELGDGDARLQFEEDLALRIAQIQGAAEDERLKEEIERDQERYAEIAKLEDALRESRGAAEETELLRRLANEERVFQKRIDLALDLGQVQAAEELQELLEIRKTQITAEFAERRRKLEETEQRKIDRARERSAREAQREFEAIAREVERFTDAIVDSILQAALATQGISDQEIEVTLDRLSAEEDAVRESFERRLIDAEEYSLQLRELALERSEFEKQVEEENASFFRRTTSSLVDFAIAEAGRQVSALIANAIATQIFAKAQLAAATTATSAAMATIAATAGPAATAVSIATFGGAAATGGAAVTASLLSTQALITSLQAANAGFETGGFTGNVHRKKVAGVVHGGEWVFEQPLVSRDPRAFKALHGMLRSGLSLRDMLSMYGVSGFQAGGPVDFALPSSAFQLVQVGDRNEPENNLLTVQLTRQLGTLNQVLGAMVSEQPVVKIQPYQSRKITEASSTQTGIKLPRRAR